MSRILLDKIDSYSEESSVEKIKRKKLDPSKKKIKKDKHRKQIDVNWNEDDR